MNQIRMIHYDVRLTTDQNKSGNYDDLLTRQAMEIECRFCWSLIHDIVVGSGPLFNQAYPPLQSKINLLVY